jgi:ribosomal-protein-alanine N-acetyltransferase
VYFIREIQESDITQIFNIDREAFGPETYPIMFFRQAYELYPKTYFVVIREIQVVGYCLGSPMVSDLKKAWILSIAVSKECQRHNCGSNLLYTTLNALQQVGCKEVLISVHPKNETAKHLFEEYGFQVVRTDESYGGPGNPRNIMRLEIDNLQLIAPNRFTQ